MGNLAHVRMRLGRHQEALDGFREFRKIPLMMATVPSPDLEMKLFVMGSSLELSVLSAKGEFGKAVEHLTALEAGLEQFGDRASTCLLYTSDAADERSSVDLGGRRILKKKTLRVTD